ncbi:uncharacterized protein VICG_01234 [Vittaforma corneae ATCC 50505]|uniref:Uncharacterized protein n=1 Tax=Vittaforma corneae (strain ATCC 50505) TaxID=993615 RepID=L2GML2_VITCO|nr:uncharacterized protein VICG_01234 [Vittaforma corneae ATCC 50505]ELA41730.1 hypothetical protein VICG_01234 [Vittaforma corneae ATCC 50505]
MSTPNKILKFLKGAFTRKNDEDVPETLTNPIDSSPKWSDGKEAICIKKSEYDSLQMEIFNQTEIIKKLKRMNEESQSVINDYENTFEALSLASNLSRDCSKGTTTKNAIVELEKLRSNEQRLKSHIQALKRDLLLCEEKAENEIIHKEQIVDSLKNEIEELNFQIKRKNSKIQELNYAISEMKVELEKKNEYLIELSVICRELLREYH